MGVKENAKIIGKELEAAVELLHSAPLEQMVDTIKAANRIYLYGCGRSGLAVRGFANRLMHLGFSVSVLGEITAPHTAPGDLLFIGSGSGETECLVTIARKAKKKGVRVVLVTMDPESSIGQLADIVLTLPGTSPKLKHGGGGVSSVQPMGSLFEQVQWLTYDAMVLALMERTGETADSMFARHADLEM